MLDGSGHIRPDPGSGGHSTQQGIRSMISSRIAIVASLAGGLMLPVAGLHAQSSLGNKSVPGVCMLSRGAVLSNAKVGKAADARLKQLAEQARTQLENQRKPLDQSIQQFQQNAKSMSDSQR